MQSLEGQYDDCTEQVFEVGLKLEQKEKVMLTKLLHFNIDFYLGSSQKLIIGIMPFYIDRLTIALKVMLED